MTNWDKHYAKRMSRLQGSEIRELLKLLERPGIISFGGGVPDPKFFPTEELAAACQRILTDPKRAAAAQQYSISEGYIPLREWLVDHMKKQGVDCTIDNILITNGSQQALDFFGKLFINPNDTVLTGWPTYLGALQAFNAYEPKYDHLPDAAHPTLASGAKFAYVMPEFQNPSGTTMTLAERHTLLDIATKADLPIVEDNAYSYLRYSGEEMPSILSLAAKRAEGIDNCKVIYCSTFSKSIVPALRIGWVVAAKDVIRKLVFIKQGADLHTSPFTQMIAHELASTIIEPHAAKVRAVYKTRRDAMLIALEKHMPDGVSWTNPEGGMFVWVTLPEHINTSDLLARAVEEENIAFVPGAAFHPDRSGKNTMRINFSLNDPVAIDEGIKRLSAVIRRSHNA